MRRHHIPIAHLHGYQREIEKCVDSNLKSDIKKYPDSDILEVIVAFANTEGGDVYLSIEDSREITGVNSAHKNPITLSAYIANNTIPPYQYEQILLMLNGRYSNYLYPNHITALLPLVQAKHYADE